MGIKKYVKHLAFAAVVALVLVGLDTKILHAEGFYNCVTYWWIEVCYWVDENDPTQDPLFNVMWFMCSFIGLC